MIPLMEALVKANIHRVLRNCSFSAAFCATFSFVQTGDRRCYAVTAQGVMPFVEDKRSGLAVDYCS